MQTFEMSKQGSDGNRLWWSPRASMLLGGAHIVVSVVILVLTILVLVGQEAENLKEERNSHPEDLFLTAKEIKLREELSYRWVNRSVVYVSAEDCKEVNGDLCYTDLYNHACCQSSPKFVRLEQVTGIDGNTYTLEEGQFFPTETCKTIPDCNLNCQCSLIDNMFRGHTVNGQWIWFLFPACCKCGNV